MLLFGFFINKILNLQWFLSLFLCQNFKTPSFLNEEGIIVIAKNLLEKYKYQDKRLKLKVSDNFNYKSKAWLGLALSS